MQADTEFAKIALFEVMVLTQPPPSHFVFIEKGSYYSPGCPQMLDPPASASQALGLEAGTTIPNHICALSI